MKVLHVYRTYFPDTQGGLEETIRQICTNTRQYGVDSRVFCLSRAPHPKIIHLPEADVYRAPLTFEVASCGFSLYAIVIFRQLLGWADIVHYHFPWPFADILHFCARVKKPTVVTYHSDIVRQQGLLKLYQPLMSRFLSRVDKIVSTSPNYLQSSDTLRHYAEKVEIIPIGLNRASYPHLNPEILEQVRTEIGNNFFLFIGVLRYYKGLHVLLEAAQKSDLKIVIAGKGPEENRLKEQASKLGLANVQFVGFVSDEVKVALFKLCRAIVFPSFLRSEAFGVTLVEGAMFKKPLISAEIGSGMSYINLHDITGLTVPPNDPCALRLAMEKLQQDPQLARQMGLQAYQRYMTLLTGRRMGDLYAQLYQKMLKSRQVCT